MHGVRRGSKPTPGELQAELQRSKLHADLLRRGLSLREEALGNRDEEDFNSRYQVVERALEANPDEYTLWAFRREVLLMRSSESPTATVEDLWKFELNLTSRALQRHPKAYPAWQHRFWLLEDDHLGTLVSPELRIRTIQEEEQLSRFMLSKDGRNFHGWAHRMRVQSLLLTQTGSRSISLAERELAFVGDKINDDFANYSAWHHRSVLLPKVHSAGPKEFLKHELKFVRQAFYTEPDIQSAWFYHRWLLNGAPARGSKAVVDDRLLEEELEACEDLLSIEPKARFALQTKVHILLLMGRSTGIESALKILEEVVRKKCPLHADLIRKRCVSDLTILLCLRDSIEF